MPSSTLAILLEPLVVQKSRQRLAIREVWVQEVKFQAVSHRADSRLDQ